MNMVAVLLGASNTEADPFTTFVIAAIFIWLVIEFVGGMS
mgnify:CR=1 FL=1